MTQLKQAFRKFFYGEGRRRGSLESSLSMLLIGLVMGLLLQSMNLKNRELVIDSLQNRIRMLEIRIWVETETSSYRSQDRAGQGADDSKIREAGDGHPKFLVCDLG